MTPEPIPDHIAAIERPCPELFNYYVLKAISTAIAAPLTMLLLYFRYHTMRYRFDAEGIHMRWGILMRQEIMLNYSRIQDIQLRSNAVERWLGLVRIDVQTASGSSGAEMTLEGIKDYTAMRDFLYSRMRGARHQSGTSTYGAACDSLTTTLTEIAAELRAIRRVLESRNV